MPQPTDLSVLFLGIAWGDNMLEDSATPWQLTESTLDRLTDRNERTHSTGLERYRCHEVSEYPLKRAVDKLS